MPLGGALNAVDAAWQTCCAEAEKRGITGSALSWEVRREMLREDLLESVRRDPLFARHDCHTLGVEWRFGEALGRPVVLELGDGRQVRFAGRLDRVDVWPEGACVIDYKTGAGNTEKGLLKDGLSVQLPVYQLAVRQTGSSDYAAVASLYRSVTRRGGFEDLPLPQDEATAAERLRDLVSDAVELVEAGCSPARPVPTATTAMWATLAASRPGLAPANAKHEALDAVRRSPRPRTDGKLRCLSGSPAIRKFATASSASSTRPSCSRPVPVRARPASSSTGT